MTKLTNAERAVYEIVEHGSMTETKAALYSKQLSILRKAGLVYLENGLYRAGSRPGDVQKRERARTRPRRLDGEHETLTVKVPSYILDELDKIGPSRAEAARLALSIALAPSKAA